MDKEPTRYVCLTCLAECLSRHPDTPVTLVPKGKLVTMAFKHSAREIELVTIPESMVREEAAKRAVASGDKTVLQFLEHRKHSECSYIRVNHMHGMLSATYWPKGLCVLLEETMMELNSLLVMPHANHPQPGDKPRRSRGGCGALGNGERQDANRDAQWRWHSAHDPSRRYFVRRCPRSPAVWQSAGAIRFDRRGRTRRARKWH